MYKGNRELHKTREGKVLWITEMKDSHLQNTIALKQRDLQPYLEEAQKRSISPLPAWYKRVWYTVRRWWHIRQRGMIIERVNEVWEHSTDAYPIIEEDMRPPIDAEELHQWGY